MATHGDFVPGATYLTCTICGRRRKFPDELTVGEDRKFRCRDACDEKTILSIDREIAASHYKREAPPLGIGFASQFENEETFLEKVAHRLQIVHPGWTPTTTFHDDFTIVPGGVGSSWTNTLSGTAAITAPSVGVARFAPGTGTALSAVTSVTVPNVTAGKFYSAASFRFASASISSLAGFGVRGTSGVRIALGHVLSSNAVFFVVAHNPPLITSALSVEIDQGEHFGEMWWNGDGVVRTAIDGAPVRHLSLSTVGFTGTPLPTIFTTTNGVILDVTDYYCAV